MSIQTLMMMILMTLMTRNDAVDNDDDWPFLLALYHV